MAPNSVAIFNSNDIYPISADSTLPFQQQRDLFYLSGIDQEESILVICPYAYLEQRKYPELKMYTGFKILKELWKWWWFKWIIYTLILMNIIELKK